MNLKAHQARKPPQSTETPFETHRDSMDDYEELSEPGQRKGVEGEVTVRV